MTAGKHADYAGGFVFLLLTAWAANVALSPDPSQLVTVGAAAHLLSLCMLLSEARRSRSLPQVPAAHLLLLAVGLALRLCSTTTYQGYLPVDASGDGPFQVLEGVALLCAVRGMALFEAQSEAPAWRPVAGALTLAALGAAVCFGDLDRSPLFDMLWAMSVYVEALASVLISRHLQPVVDRRGRLPLGFVLPQLLGYACRVHFWHCAFGEIAPEKPVYLQQYFPQVLCSVHWLPIAAYGALLVESLGPAPEPQPEPAEQPEAKAPQMAGLPQLPGGEADYSTLRLAELEIRVPKGCTQLIPVRAEYTKEGTLRVAYQPVC